MDIVNRADAVKIELVKPVIQKVFYNVGPLMSYADMRSEILNFVEDMANNGV